jgi:predicted nucleic acid-binding protein
MDECVVDASVAIKLFLVEPLVDRAQALFARLEDSPPLRMYAPDLLYVECANILWKRVRFRGYDPSLPVTDLATLQTLPIASVPTRVLADTAIALAIRWDISAYDACYVALADVRACTLVTADERLVQRLADSTVTVQELGTL